MINRNTKKDLEKRHYDLQDYYIKKADDCFDSWYDIERRNCKY